MSPKTSLGKVIILWASPKISSQIKKGRAISDPTLSLCYLAMDLLSGFSPTKNSQSDQTWTKQEHDRCLRHRYGVRFIFDC